MKLSKGIGEIQKGELQFIWQPPDIYEEVHKNNIWLIYGRKGSGKSTLVEFLGTDHIDSHVIIIRPRKVNIFQKVMSSLKDVERIKDSHFLESGGESRTGGSSTATVSSAARTTCVRKTDWRKSRGCAELGSEMPDTHVSPFKG